jgi:hypothetical protein
MPSIKWCSRVRGKPRIEVPASPSHATACQLCNAPLCISSVKLCVLCGEWFSLPTGILEPVTTEGHRVTQRNATECFVNKRSVLFSPASEDQKLTVTTCPLWVAIRYWLIFKDGKGLIH